MEKSLHLCVFSNVAFVSFTLEIHLLNDFHTFILLFFLLFFLI
jgi:hypothetical protein